MKVRILYLCCGYITCTWLWCE